MGQMSWSNLLFRMEQLFANKKEHNRIYALKTIYSLLWCKKLCDMNLIQFTTPENFEKNSTPFQIFIEIFLDSSFTIFFQWLEILKTQYPEFVPFIIQRLESNEIQVKSIPFTLPWWSKLELHALITLSFCEPEKNLLEIKKELNTWNSNDEIRLFLNSPEIEQQFLRELLFPEFKQQKDLGAYYTPPQLVSYLTRKVLYQKVMKIFESLYLSGKNEDYSSISHLINPVWEKIVKSWTSEKQYSADKFILPLKENFSKNDLDRIKTDLFSKIWNLTILDPSCGDGNFLVEYFLQRKKWLNLLYVDNDTKKMNQESDFIGIYGIDIDPNAILTTQFRLFLLVNKENVSQIIPECSSFKRQFFIMEPLIDKFPAEFPQIDIILSNPPYVNLIEQPQLRRKLELQYPAIYHGKLDLCYYFLPKILDLLTPDGFCGIVLKRYFLKSPVGRNLRKFLLDQSAIQEICDFGKLQMFQQAGIETLLCIFSPKQKPKDIARINPNPTYFTLITEFPRENQLLEACITTFYQFNLEKFEDRWDFSPNPISSHFEKPITEYTGEDFGRIYPHLNELKPSCSVFLIVKGIQTGKDQVFIVNSSMDLEPEKTAPFIKGQHISPFRIRKSGRNIILSHRYSTELKAFPKIQTYLEMNRHLLEGRSRANGSAWALWRKGDERNTVDFSIPKLVWPYRGQRFYCAIDRSGSFHSQDVILMTINKKGWNHGSVENLQAIYDFWSQEMIYFYLALFNSPIFEKYLFGHAKEFAIHVKDFQPNNFEGLHLPLYNSTEVLQQEIMQKGKQLEVLIQAEAQNQKQISILQQQLNEAVKKLFKI